ncbi:MAG TPA: NUDIX domain-containing protein [Gammaproteobacteria bacterium]|nr:NUDIX domain-containing protein [Gammaproteobacteria bacterium]
MSVAASGSEPVTTAIATDVVIFTVRNDELAVLLRRRQREPFAGLWSLPGGFLGGSETPEAGAQRVVRDKVGMAGLYIEQLFTFGAPNRDPRGRVVTVAHFALLPWDRAERVASAERFTSWEAVDSLPGLAFDHGGIVDMARRRLVAKLDYSTIALQLMAERFTLSELQAVYEAILGGPLDKRNFRKRVRTFECIEATDELYRAGKHRPARLYRIKRPGEVQIIK